MRDDFFDEKNRVKGNVSNALSENISYMERLFSDCGDVVSQKFEINFGIRAFVIYVDGLADAQLIEDFVLRPLKQETTASYDKDGTLAQKKEALQQVLELSDVTFRQTMDEVVLEILSGNTILFFDGVKEALMISSKAFPTRGVSEVDSERTMRGAKDAFNENMRTSTALLRRRIRDSRLKIKQIYVGQRSRTNVAVCYVEGLVKEKWLEEIEERMSRYEIDAIYDSGMLEQLMEPEWHSVFPQFQHTERPDKAASALLEGRVAIVVDNSPDVLLLPATCNTFFQASDDYYGRYEIAIFARLLRYAACILAIGLPGLYLAVIGFHTEMLPVKLVLTIAEARQQVPFPAVVEVLLMELEFELLKEAGIRLPGQMGSTIGVVGGLIVGQAAVEAGLVSTIVVIVVALTAIASFAIPNEAFTSAFRLLKFFFILVCAFFGVYGFFLGMLMLIIHLSSLESMGVPYLMPAVSNVADASEEDKDFILKLPIQQMRLRPFFTKRGAKRRLRKEGHQ